MIWHEFKAIGTEIAISAALDPGQQHLLLEAQKAIFDFEKRFSRFVAGNELSLLNDSNDEEQEVSVLMADMLTEAKRYYLETGTIFDPTIIGSLESAGYDRSFDKIIANQDGLKDVLPKNPIKPYERQFRLSDLDISGQTVRRPRGLRIDLGGIGKGYIVDLLGSGIFSGVSDYWISAGGDIIASGSQPGGQGWNIGVQNPTSPEDDAFSIDTKGAKLGIATSGIIKRQGSGWNHIIDPRTGLPVANDILSVTAISSSAMRADIFAKTVLILGDEDGLEFIEAQEDSACIIFIKDKPPLFSKRAKFYLRNI